MNSIVRSREFLHEIATGAGALAMTWQDHFYNWVLPARCGDMSLPYGVAAGPFYKLSPPNACTTDTAMVFEKIGTVSNCKRNFCRKNSAKIQKLVTKDALTRTAAGDIMPTININTYKC